MPSGVGAGGTGNPLRVPLWPIDEEPQHQPPLLTTVLDLDQVEAGVAHVGLGEQPQVLNVLSHAGLVRLEMFPFCFVSGLCLRAKKKGGHAAHPSLKEATQFQGGVL